MVKSLAVVATFFLAALAVQADELATAPPEGVELRLLALKDMAGTPGALIPYQPVCVKIAFDKERWRSEAIPSYKIKLHAVRINGEPVAAEDLKGMTLNGYRDATSEGVQWFHGFGCKGIIPRLPGDYRVDVVVETPKGLWRMPTQDIRIVIPKGEEGAYSAMLARRVPLLLEHPWGMRSALALVKDEAWWGVRATEIPNEERPPYADVLRFVQEHPKSIFTRLVYDRCLNAYGTDRRGESGRMGVLPPFMHADRVEIARLLMAIDAEQTAKIVERQIAVFREELARRTDENGREVAEGRLYWYQCWAKLLEQVRTSGE